MPSVRGTQQPTPDHHLTGVPGSRDQLPTPALILDEQVLRANIGAMTEVSRAAGLALRPHFKAHKCLEICRLQLEAGAVGFCAATIGEAEILAELSVSTLVTSIVASEINLVRAAEVQASHGRLMLVVDSIDGARRMNEAFSHTGRDVDVLIDIDTGRHRSGCNSLSDARALAREVGTLAHLRLRGLQVYAGHLSHMRDAQERALSYQVFERLVREYERGLRDVLPPSPIVSGGSTGSLAGEVESRVLTELQCGSYVVMDVEYLSMDYSTQAREWPFRAALSVQASILSNHWSDHAIADAGDKRFASKYGYDPGIVRLPHGFDPESATYRPQSDEHGRLDYVGPSPPPVGSRIECSVPHCDPTINLFSTVYVVHDDHVVDVWTIDARGA